MTSGLTPVKYARKIFVVEVVMVTEENMEEAAAWCNGEVKRNYIKVPVRNPVHERQTKAFVGDRILLSDTGCKVYTAKAFEASFEPYEETNKPKPGPMPKAPTSVAASISA